MAIEKTYTHVPPIRARSQLDRLARVVTGSFLFPFYWVRTKRRELPGLGFAVDSFRFGLRSLVRGNGEVPNAEIYRILFEPVESTRYFEFGLAWEFVSDFRLQRYLDVSSPRLFPLALMTRRPASTAALINPDEKDLKLTAGLLRACGLDGRCDLWGCLIEEAPLLPATFDLVTSLSVVEHIPDDRNAIRQMWDLLKPGGKLVLSVPCGAVAEEQFVNVDHYGLQQPDQDGFVFLQYIYDEARLQERIYSVTGVPTRYGIYGEREPGTLRRGLVKKWSGAKYPMWKEPYNMAKKFQRYGSLADLPGEGVIVMEFHKR